MFSDYEDFIRKRLAEVGYCAQAIFEELQEMGCKCGYDTVRRFVKPLREESGREATVRFEIPQGRQFQVDWGQQGSSFCDVSRVQSPTFCPREKRQEAGHFS